MANQNNGGPACPQSVSKGSAGDAPIASFDFVDASGMSLRDYFAAQAMPQVIAHIMTVRATMIKPGQFNFDEVGDTAYQVADAMIRARAQTETK